jgi:hypothetical protein
VGAEHGDYVPLSSTESHPKEYGWCVDWLSSEAGSEARRGDTTPVMYPSVFSDKLDTAGPLNGRDGLPSRFEGTRQRRLPGFGRERVRSGRSDTNLRVRDVTSARRSAAGAASSEVAPGEAGGPHIDARSS